MSSETAPTGLAPLPHHPLVYRSVLDLIGDTALVEIALGNDAPRAEVLGKLEYQNPGGSVKDRICLAMIEAAEKSGQLKPGGVVVEPTSGNTGIGLALVCARRGYRCILTMPESMSLERRALLEALGAQVVLTPGEEQMEGAIKKAQEIAATTPNSFQPQQFDNPENPSVHYRSTGREIEHALGGAPLHAFVAGVGTGGTVSGVGRYLREHQPDCRVIAVEPEACATISRGERGPTKIQGLAAGFVPRNYTREIPHEVRTVSDRDAYDTKQALARKCGILVGVSAGAATYVALQVARELGPGKRVVVVLPDSGERYFSLDEYFTSTQS
ncbi:MAG TPA: cysteine synthase A [Polyangiaceae bacterium]|jgi:cysteine synthase A|nr:cysteine synthase A [Polyangiaceae bacterium]